MNHAQPDGQARSGPLRDITVIDLTQHLSGPFASQILGDLGARIIKIEPPAGDSTRQIGPYFVDGDSVYYLSVNRNKESVCIDLKAPGGREALLALVANADLVLENFRPGTMAKLGLDHAALQAVNDKIVLCSISGFGQTGPYRDRPAFDMIVQALSGGMSLTGDPDGQPVRSGLPIGDLCAGMYGVIGALAALSRVTTEGRGSYVDVAMLDTQISLLSYVASYALTGGAAPGRQGRAHMSIPTYRALTCADDQDIVIAANTERMWPGLCDALDTPHLTHDERFADNNARRTHRDQLDPLLTTAARTFTSTDLLDRLRAAGIPCAPLNDVDQALHDPQVQSRDMVLDLPYGTAAIHTVGNPVKTTDQRHHHTPPPTLGQHTDTFLRTLAGLDDHHTSDRPHTTPAAEPVQ
jgi:CoA:oxalate CoA-transferase